MTHDVYTIAHLSDLHVTPVQVTNPTVLFNKRILGWLSWTLRRQKLYRPEMLQTLINDLHQQHYDSVVVTGDIANLSLESEFPAAVSWLQQIGNPEKVFVIPGNHDAYVALSYGRSWQHWEAYLQSDSVFQTIPNEPTPNGSETPAKVELMQKLHAEGIDYPTVRIRPPIVFIGVNSALPPASWLDANGLVGSQQLQRLEQLLQQFSATALCRVVLIHHPPDEEVSARRRLTDTAAFCEVLRKAGAELVLHGHLHKTVRRTIPGPTHAIPVIGVRSSSATGAHRPRQRAQYHLYRIERDKNGAKGNRFRIRMSVRSYDPTVRSFIDKVDLTL